LIAITLLTILVRPCSVIAAENHPEQELIIINSRRRVCLKHSQRVNFEYN
jgi:hypothetical protein